MRFNYILKWFLMSVMVLMMSACDNGGGGDTTTPTVEENTTTPKTPTVEENTTTPTTPTVEENNTSTNLISGYVIDDAIEEANITIFSLDGDILESNITTDSQGYYEVSISNLSDGYIVSSRGGKINGKAFNNTMSAICLADTINSCNITPHTTIIEQLLNQYSGSVESRLEKTLLDIKDILSLESDPFILESNGNSIADVNLSVWREEINSLGLSSIIDTLRGDLHDGYIDENSIQKIFKRAKIRVETTASKDTLEIDKSVALSVKNDKNTTLGILPEGTKISHKLYSMSREEQGDNVVSKGYLSDIAYIEEQDYSEISGDANDTTERIVYQSFNLGKWKKTLNSETTILSKVFMNEPTLLFISNSEKEIVANYLIEEDLFAQAIEEYNKMIENNLDSSSILDSLIQYLSAKATEQLDNTQIINSANIIVSKISPSKIMRKRINDTSIFSAFSGMKIGYDKTLDNLKVYSRSSLWYGLQSIENYGKGFWSDLGTVSLISPKVGFVSGEDFHILDNTINASQQDEVTWGSVVSDVSLSDLDSNLVENTYSEVIMYRNNPNSSMDLPQIMNTVSIMQLILKTAIGSSTAFESEKIKSALTLLEKAKNSSKTVKFAWGLIKASTATNNLVCQLSDKKNGLACSESENFSKILGSLDSLVGTIPSTGSITKEEYHKDISALTIALAKMLITKGEKLDENILNKIAPLVITNAFIMPIAKITGTNIEVEDAYEFALIMKGQGSIAVTDHKLNRVIIMLREAISENPDILEKLTFSVDKIMSLVDGVTNLDKLFKDIDKMGSIQIVGLILEKLLKDSIDGAISSMATNVLKSLTPAKYFDILTAANEGSAMAYDWMFKPSMVKMTIKHSSTDSDGKRNIDIDHSIPDIKPIRYLTIPKENDLIVTKTIPKNLIQSTFEESRVIALGAGEQDNHFLVMEGFKSMIENKTAFNDSDKGTIKGLMDSQHIKLAYHSKEFKSTDTIMTVSRDERVNCTDAEVINESCVRPIAITNTFWWDTDSLKWADDNHPIEKKVLGEDINDYTMIDFSEFLKNTLGIEEKYPFIEPKKGIFSSYLEIELTNDFQDADSEASRGQKRYANTINYYVLENLYKYKDIFHEISSVAYTTDSYIHPSALYLNFDKADNKELYRSFKMILQYEVNGKTKFSKSIPLGESLKRYSLPTGNDVKNIKVLIFDNILETYSIQSGKGLLETISSAKYYLNNSNLISPILILNVDDLRKEDFVEASIDTDEDELSDIFDAFPNNPEYQFDFDEDGMADKWEERYELNPNNSADALTDKDKDSLTNLKEFNLNSNPIKDDTDDDKMLDNFEDKYNLNLLIDDTLEDKDADGVSNIEEYADDTNPSDKTSFTPPLLAPKITIEKINDSSVKIKWDEATTDVTVMPYCLSSTLHLPDYIHFVDVDCYDDSDDSQSGYIDNIETDGEFIINNLLPNKIYNFRMSFVRYRYPYADDVVSTSDEMSIDTTTVTTNLKVNAGEDKEFAFGINAHLISSVEGNDNNVELIYSWKEDSIELSNKSYLLKSDWEVGEHKVILSVTDGVSTVEDDIIVTITQAQNTTINHGLVAHYKFDGDANDSSGNRNHGTEYGGVTYVDGVIGQALSVSNTTYTGKHQYIQFYMENYSDFTQSFFVNFNKLSSNDGETLLSCGKHTENNFYGVWINEDGKLNINYQDSNGNDLITQESVVLNKDKFELITLVYKNNELNTYINGEQKSKITINNLQYSSNQCYLGAHDWAYSESSRFNGQIDDLRIYNRALNEAEVKELYEMGQVTSNERFKKIDNSGKIVSDTTTQWSYTYDTKSKILWENKINKDETALFDSTSPDYSNLDIMHDYDNRYSIDNMSTIIQTLEAQSYFDISDWRLPSTQEFKDLISDPEFDNKFFPNFEGLFYTNTMVQNGVNSQTLEKIWLENGITSVGVPTQLYKGLFVTDDFIFLSPPTAKAGEDQNITLGESVTLSATQSTDTQTPKSELIYEWSGETISTSYDENYTIDNLPLGEHNITLRVTDSDDSSGEDNITVRVIEAQSSNLSNGLVAHYKFDGDANDSSGNRNHGTEYGGVTYVDGVIGQAGSFDGVDDYINTDRILPFDGQTIYSISGWFNTAIGGEILKTTENIAGTSKSGGLSVELSKDDGHIIVYISSDGVDNRMLVYDESFDYRDGNWHHYVFKYNGNLNYTGVEIFIDGIKKELLHLEQDSISYNGSEWSHELQIARSDDIRGISYYNGQIDDLRIYNRALNEAEIQELYGMGTKNATTDTNWMDKANELMSWSDATTYCADNGGRLPTLEELEAEVTNCGGVISDSVNNMYNTEYQSCYKNNGFTSNEFWSSTNDERYPNNAFNLYFNTGYIFSNNKPNGLYVRCVRVGQ